MKLAWVAMSALLVATGCTGSTGSTVTTAATKLASSPTEQPSTPTSPAPTTTPANTAPTVTLRMPDGARRFWVRDTHFYTSRWYSGAHRIMIGFGCTPAPYYSVDPRCPHGEGFHHGIDVDMPCGNPLYAAVSGTVVDPSAAGSLGSAYGPWAFRIRHQERGVDIVIGHVRTVFVHAGDSVRPGQRIALASNAGAPDGCHLHFEVRPIGGGYSTAVPPAPYLRLRR